MDFANDDLMDALRRAMFVSEEKTVYIWEGVCMYLQESSVLKTLGAIALHSAAGSTLVADYANDLGIQMGKFIPNGAGGIPTHWSEPWIFGVPGANGSEFFRELGFDPGVPLSANDPEIRRRYSTRKDGSSYAARALEKLRTQEQDRPRELPSGFLDAQKAVAAAGGAYWFTELTVVDKAKGRQIVS